MLIGIGPADPSTYLVTALLQTVVALGACALPAMKAMRADPMRALRQE
jgi:ABC-type lipoprotein release transport system permease subunit